MPPANHVVLASGAAVAVSVAVATAIAIYESPELRRYADDVRRRIAVALHSMGDGINPPHREPLFNRPEDAHGFLQSGAEPGVEADEETRRRQREELLYWNSLRVQKAEANVDAASQGEKKMAEGDVTDSEKTRSRSYTFDDFMRKDDSAEEGTYVFNSGTDVKKENDNQGLRNRGDKARVLLASSLYANPFADEHGIGNDVLDDVSASQIAPDQDETMSDLYSATTVERPEPSTPTVEGSIPEPSLINFSEDNTPARSGSSATVDNEQQNQQREHEEGQEEEYITAGQEDRAEAYASIQAWAASSGPGFYSPLPSTPAVPVSEPELLSDGQLTPTDSMSLAGSGEDIADEVSRDGEAGRALDVLSDSDGMLTPASWSEVGSVVSESDAPIPARA